MRWPCVSHRMNGHSPLMEPNMKTAISWAAAVLGGLGVVGLALGCWWRWTGRAPWSPPDRGRD